VQADRVGAFVLDCYGSEFIVSEMRQPPPYSTARYAHYARIKGKSTCCSQWCALRKRAPL
jgi:hypothetical protein